MKHLKTPILLVALWLFSKEITFSANLYRRCSSYEVLQRQLQEDPGMQQRMDQIEQFTSDYIRQSATQRNTSPGSTASVSATITIPVVVHVLYNTVAQNISDQLIQAQIDVLNKDYSALNTDRTKVPSAFSGLVANTHIQFCLAQRDPQGKATTGIVRKQTSVVAFIDDDKVKNSATGGDDAWDRNKYLNLWVCNLGNGLLGYAQFPGGQAATDGVVILYSSLPGGSSSPYNIGRTATHEIGHWLNLRHIWGDANCGDDLVSDTPTQQTYNFGCPAYPHVTCSNSGDMSMNYMDYTDDACMYMFTAGQAARINALFASGGARASILSSDGCQPPVQLTCGVPTDLSASNLSPNSATLSWSAVSGAQSYTIQYKVSTAGNWSSLSSTNNTVNLSGLKASTVYNFRVQAICAVAGTYSNTSSFTTPQASAGCGIPGGLNAASVTANSALLSWNAVSGAKKYNIQYKTASATAWKTVNTNTTSKSISGLSAGTTYNYKVQAVCSTAGLYSPVASFTTMVPMASVCSESNEPNNAFNAATLLPVNTDIQSQISSATDVDWYKFSNSAASPNIKVTLNNLPYDYDIELYNASGNFLIMSDNAGIASESIVYNSAPVGTYYIKVLGYGGTFSGSCYTLKAQTSNALLREMEAVDSKSALHNDRNVTVFPNPSSGDFNIRYLSETEKRVSFIVYDLAGNIMKSEIMDAGKGENLISISMPTASNGIYLMDVNDGKENKIYKMIVNK